MSMEEDTHEHEFVCALDRNICIWCGVTQGETTKNNTFEREIQFLIKGVIF